MKKMFYFPLIVFLGSFSNRTWSQTDTLEKVSSIIWYTGFGGGPCTRGGSFEMSFDMASSKNHWGGSLNFKTGFILLGDIPSDYGGQFGRLPPADDFTVLSFNLLKKFPTSYRYLRFGLETGPSWVRYNLTKLELNPYYPDPFQYKYNKVHTLKNTFGISLTAKAEFPFSSFLGCELAVFTVINKIQSFWGLDFCLSFGNLRKH
jgi:hypothetical protein